MDRTGCSGGFPRWFEAGSESGETGEAGGRHWGRDVGKARDRRPGSGSKPGSTARNVEWERLVDAGKFSFRVGGVSRPGMRVPGSSQGRGGFSAGDGGTCSAGSAPATVQIPGAPACASQRTARGPTPARTARSARGAPTPWISRLAHEAHGRGTAIALTPRCGAPESRPTIRACHLQRGSRSAKSSTRTPALPGPAFVFRRRAAAGRRSCTPAPRRAVSTFRTPAAV